MTAREVILDGGSPWGFRMHGGVDVQQPLRISRVNPGSKASNKGIREGDIITSINNQPTRDLTNSDAHVLLKRSGDNLKLGLNEDCKGSPKRRQYKTVQQEIHSESIERSNTSCTKTITFTINRNQSDPNESELLIPKRYSHLQHNGEPENGVISQRSTLSSSSCSSSPSVTSLQGESRGSETRQETRDSAARNKLSGNFIETTATKRIATDKEENVIADTVMGGHSRSHKKRSRENRKKSMNTNLVSTNTPIGETMVEMSTSSDGTGNVVNNSDVENKRVQDNNYRVESPETVTQKPYTIIKSKSLDDDDLVKITELSETSESEDKNATSECNALITEANSDVEWEETVELKSEEFGECLSSTTSTLEGELTPIQVTLISPEDEESLRVFLQGINLVTSPEELTFQVSKKEGYKERKARKRAAIAEHFMPVLQHPRYLDVIKEESSDNNSDSNLSEISKTEKGEKVVVVGGKLTESASVQGTWSTSLTEKSNFDAEFVYLEDSDDSSDNEEKTETEFPTTEILPPASQLTPPPTPENPTPKNERIIQASEVVFDKEFKNFCVELNLDEYKFVNSPSISPTSSDSSKTQCTVVYNPKSELISKDQSARKLLSLRELCLKTLMELPFGAEVLQELALVSRGIEELTGYSTLEKLRKHLPASISFSLKPSNERQQTNDSFTIPATRKDMTLNPYSKWVGIPTQQDPNVLVCLSPTQKSHLETTKAVPDEAGKLLELHQMYLNRRGYYEKPSNERDDIKITKLSSNLDTINEKLSHPVEFSNRLLAIIRESSNTERSYDATQRDSKDNKLFSVQNNMVMEKVDELRGWKLKESNLAREKSASVPQDLSNEICATVLNEGTQVQSTFGNINISKRRFSLPQEVHQRQIQYIREREREIQNEIEELEKEKQKLLREMAAEETEKQFEADQYHISKKGDIAIRNDEKQPLKTEIDQQKTIVMAPTEIFRQQMYNEYMQKIADREERKLLKVIKITSSRSEIENNNNNIINNNNNNNLCEVKHVCDIENEFMDKVKERMRKYGLKRDDSEESRINLSDREDSTEPVLVIDGESLTNSKGLPKHLREFVDITRRAADNNEGRTDEGVWSPGQKHNEEKQKQDSVEWQKNKEDNETIPPVWTPRSAGSSPTAERKEFKSVNFESPTLGRKNKSQTDNSEQESQPPWKVSTSTSDVGSALSSSLEKRLPTSHSAPASGFTEFSSSRLPKAQNPTITLLQKAREGQLPRGASYIQTESTSYKRDDKPPVLTPGQVLYHIKNEYTVSDSEGDKPRRMADIGRRKFEIGIGPTTKDGMPLVLRSEIKDGNQSRWYKKMYDTIHKQKPDREYVTVRYKQRRARYPYTSGYFSEPEQHSAFSADYYDSDGTASDHKYATLDRRRIQPSRDKENDYMSSTIPRDRETIHTEITRHGQDVYKNQPGRIENYLPGRSSISEKEAKEWWDEVMDIFDGWLDDHSALPSYNYLLTRAITRSHLEQQKTPPPIRGYMSQALKESGYESDSTLIFRRREDALQQLSPSEQKEAYKTIQKGGDVPLQGLRKPAPERPKELPPPTPPPKGHRGIDFFGTESPRRYVENDVTIHYKTPIRQEVKEPLSEEELSRRQAEHMRRVYEEERRRKYLQVRDFPNELQDMNSRRHTDNFIPSQKSPIPLNRYDDFPIEDGPKIKPRPRSPEHRLIARALYNFVGQSARELTFRKGDIIYIRRQVDKNWYEGEHNAMIGLFPANYAEIIPYDGVKSTPRRNHEGQARAKFNFIAQTHLELSLAKGELVVITRKVDDNWYEGRIGGRKGIFPVSYVEVLIDPGIVPPSSTVSSKPVASPAAHSMLLNGSAGGKESMGSHSYTPSYHPSFTSSYRAKPAQVTGPSYAALSKSTSSSKNPINEALHIDTHSEPVPYRALYKYRPQNDDELELMEGDVVYVLEKCDDGWYVGSSQRTGAFGTFPGNYVERI
ncbi:hypothetical protein FQR65_LT09248 [Abscondita terminalis]|nr:hypothetical protein FQR65_LT09248 [Abscondita terminalis]